MANYFIIGGDGKEYGPITEVDVRQWVAEGRLAALSLAKAESDAEFRPLEKFPEFATLFVPAVLGMAATPPPIAPPKPPPSFTPGGASENVLPDDYELDIMGCLTRGYELVKENFGTLFVGSLIYWGIQFGVGMFSSIPLVGILFTVANFVCTGPLMAGLFYLFIRVNRGERAEVGEVFSGFRRGFTQFFLATLVQALFMILCLLPVILMFGIKMVALAGKYHAMIAGMQNGAPPDQAAIDAMVSVVFAALPVMLVCAIPMTYLGVCWKFTLPLIIDQQMDFIAAMKASWKMVNKHWFVIFGLILLISVLNLAGMVLCCVPVLFTFPVGLAALMIAYETIFCAAKK